MTWTFPVFRGGRRIHRAASRGDYHVLENILSRQPTMVDVKDCFGLTPLQYAASYGQLVSAKLLLDRGAKLSMNVFVGACVSGNAILVEELIKAGAHSYLNSNERSAPPLHFAAGHGQRDVVEVLIRYEADVNSIDAQGRSALDVAVANGNSDVIKLLTEAGAIKRSTIVSDL